MSSLTLDITADPEEFEEAVAEFLSRRVVSRAEADTIEEYARRRAWWISGVAQMDVVQDVHDSITEALRKGTSFEEWKKTAGPKLEQAWGRKDSARIQLIFRNASMQAYNAGRWEQMQAPHVRAVRPFGMLDVVDDSRTSDVCRKFLSPPVILPLDDPRWQRLNPPFHHGCRTGIRTLRREVAERKGITQGTPDLEVDEGWGYPPNLTEPPKPSERKNPPDPDVQVEMASKAGKDARKRKPKVITQKPEHTPEHWEPHYRAQYGDAGRPMAYGRALFERSKVLSVDEARAKLRPFVASGIPGSHAADAFLAADGASDSQIAYGKLVAEHLATGGGADPKVTHTRGRLAPAAKAVDAFYRSWASPRLQFPGSKIQWKYWTRRGEFGWMPGDLTGNGTIRCNGGVAVSVHEFGHSVEIGSPAIQKAIQAFLAKRTAGESAELLPKLAPGCGYGWREFARPDKLASSYMGKVVPAPASELFSTSVGWLAAGDGVLILEKDPESLQLIIGILSGWL